MDNTKALSDDITPKEENQQEPSFGFFLFCITVVGSIAILLPFVMV